MREQLRHDPADGCLRLRGPVRRCVLQFGRLGAWYDMHHAVVMRFQLAQEIRHHGGRRRAAIVKQDHAAPRCIEPRHDQLQFGFRTHLQPIGSPEVGAEHCQLLCCKPRQERLRVGKAGEAEKRNVRGIGGGRTAVARAFIGCDALRDFKPRGLIGQPAHRDRGMRPRVVCDGVVLADLSAHDLRIGRSILPDQKEGRADALRFQRIEHFAGRLGQGTVVERQNDFAVFQL